MSKKKMVPVELKAFLFRKADGTEEIGMHDHTKGNTDEYWMNEMGACMGTIVIIGEYEGIEGDPVEKIVEGLERAITKERADSQVRVNALMERISNLKSLTHEAAQ